MHQMEFEMVTLRLHDRTMWTIYQSETFTKFNGSWINHCVTPNTYCHYQLQWEYSTKLPSWSQDLWFSRIWHSNGLCQMENRCNCKRFNLHGRMGNTAVVLVSSWVRMHIAHQSMGSMSEWLFVECLRFHVPNISSIQRRMFNSIEFARAVSDDKAADIALIKIITIIHNSLHLISHQPIPDSSSENLCLPETRTRRDNLWLLLLIKTLVFFEFHLWNYNKMKYLHLALLGMRQNQILSPISFVDFVASLQRKVHRTQASTPLTNCHVVPTALPVKRRPLFICSWNPFDAKHLKYAKCCVWIASCSEFRWKMFINKSDLAKFCLFPNFSLPTAYGVCRMGEELCRIAVRKDV